MLIKRKKLSKIIILISTTIAAGILSSCRDYSEVKKLGDTWETIEKTAGIISNDFYQSCLRKSRYPASARIFGLTDYFNVVREEKQKCDSNDYPTSQNMLTAYKTYSSYLKKLSELADENTGAITSEQQSELQSAISNLFGQLGNTGVTVPTSLSENIGAGTNIIAVIFGFIGDNIRQNALAPTIFCTDDEIKKYSNGLSTLSSTVYINQLRIERGALESHITNFTPVTDGRLSVLETSALFNMENVLVSRISDLDERAMIARNFAKVLDATANAHTELKELFKDDINLKEGEESFCKNYEKEAAKNASKKKKANIQISPKKAIHAAKILNDYNQDIQPIIKQITSSRLYKSSTH